MEADNQRLQDEVNQLKKQKRSERFGDVPENLEAEVRAKIAAGLSREMAIKVVQDQAEWDATQAREAKKK